MKIYQIKSSKYRGCGKGIIAVKNNEIIDICYYSDLEEKATASMITDARIKNKLVSNPNFKKYAKPIVLDFFQINKRNKIEEFKKAGCQVFKAMMSCQEALVIGNFCQL